GNEAIDRRKPVFAIAKVGYQLEAAGRFAETDKEYVLAIAIHHLERAGVVPRACGVRLPTFVERAALLHDPTWPDGASSGPQQHFQGLPRACALEYVPGLQRELFGEPLLQPIVDAGELHAVDDALVDIERQVSCGTRKGGGDACEPVAFVVVMA